MLLLEEPNVKAGGFLSKGGILGLVEDMKMLLLLLLLLSLLGLNLVLKLFVNSDDDDRATILFMKARAVDGVFVAAHHRCLMVHRISLVPILPMLESVVVVVIVAAAARTNRRMRSGDSGGVRRRRESSGGGDADIGGPWSKL